MSKRFVGILRVTAWHSARRNFMGNGRGENYAVALLRIGEEWKSTALRNGG